VNRRKEQKQNYFILFFVRDLTNYGPKDIINNLINNYLICVFIFYICVY
jgi:hypothetical protein